MPAVLWVPRPHGAENRHVDIFVGAEGFVVLEDDFLDHARGEAEGVRHLVIVLGVDIRHVDATRGADNAQCAKLAVELQFIGDQSLLRHGVHRGRKLSQESLAALTAQGTRYHAAPTAERQIIIAIVVVSASAHHSPPSGKSDTNKY